MTADAQTTGIGEKLKRFHARYESSRPARAESLLGQALFFVPFCVWFGMNLLWVSTFAEIIVQFITVKEARAIILYSRWICLGVLAVREIAFGRHDRRSLIGLAVAAFFAAMAFPMIRTHYYLFDTVWFVYAARDIPFKRIAKVIFVEMTALYALIVVFALVGITDNAAFEDASRGTRYGLGFSSPNAAPVYSVFIFCTWAYLRGARFGWVDAVGMVALECALFYATDSRTAFVLGIVLAVLLVAPKLVRARKPKRVFGVCVVGSVAVLAVASLALCAFYDPEVEWMALLNKLTSARLKYGHEALAQYGTPVFGQTITVGNTNTYNRFTGEFTNKPPTIILDNTYIRTLVFCGWIALVAGVASVTATLYKLYRKADYRLLAIVFVPILYSVMEAVSANLYYNPFLFLIAIVLLQPAKPREASESE